IPLDEMEDVESDVFRSSELPPLAMSGGEPEDEIEKKPAKVRFYRKEGRLILEGSVAREVKKETMQRVARSLQWIDSVEDHVEVDLLVESMPAGERGNGFLTAFLQEAANGEITVEKDRLILAGELYSTGTKGRLLSRALSFADGRAVINHLKVIPPVLMVAVEVKGEMVYLRGFLPGEEVHKELLSSVWKELPGQQVVDEIVVSEKMAATPNSMRLPTLAAEFFSRVPAGAFEFREGRVRLTGHAGQWSERDELVGDVNRIFEYGVKVDDYLVAEVPSDLWKAVSLSVRKDGMNLYLEGNLPSGELKNQLLSSVALAFPRAEVIENVAVSSQGGWNVFTEKMPRFWDHFLSRVKDPSFVLQNGKLDLYGRLQEVREQKSLAAQARGLLGLNVKVSSHLDGSALATVDAVSLMDEGTLNARLKSLPIYFGVNRTSVSDSEMTKVKELAVLIPKSASPLVIAGFADQKGDPEYNRELGLKRAASVKRALEKLGVDTDGIETESVVAKENGKEVRRVEIKAVQVTQA
ncbi:MAG: OmpA family protein, partial [Verrucomicrobiota bacterium]